MKLKTLLDPRLILMRDVDNSYYPLNKLPKSPFKNYKQALNYLFQEINKKTMLSNYNANEIDWALYTLFKSKKFMKIIKP